MTGTMSTIAVAAPSPASSRAIPPAVWLLAMTTFAITSSEFMVAGMLPMLARAFDVSIGSIGYLISLYALGMAVGGPLVTALLLHLKVPHRRGLIWLLALFLVGSLIAATALGYPAMAIGRVIQGVASAGYFGVALTICAELVAPDLRGRAASYVLAGLMLSPVAGVPTLALIAGAAGWQAAFWTIVAVTLVCIALIATGLPASPPDADIDLGRSAAALLSARLWAVYATSGLVIGATFAAFSYVAPIFTTVTGLSPRSIPLLLAGYGVANILGNIVIGRFADRFTILILASGLATLAAALAVLALCATVPAVAIAAFLVIGLVGVALNPAMVVRVMRAAHPGPLVNSLHTSVITAGLALGTWAGGAAIDRGYGLTAPLWVGVALAILGLLSLAPPSLRRA